MKNKILIMMFTLAALFIWSCNEPPPIGPETPDGELSKKVQVPVGTVTPILSLPTGDSPEGITIDKSGHMYISNTRGDNRSINEILRVRRNGTYSVYATLPAGKGHATGLVTDKKGNVYVAFYTYGDLSRNGVYRINRKGHIKRLRGSKNIARPNALTFDSKGNLYVTSSYGEGSYDEEPNYEGAVWRFGKNKKFKRWFMDGKLDGGSHPVGTLPGANGIVFYPPNKLYVANTAQSSVSMIKIGGKGNAVSINVVGQDFLLMNIDGIAVDIHENIYGVLPPSTLTELGAPPLPPLVKLNPYTEEVTPVVVPDDAFNFNTPTSLTFATRTGPWNSKSVFVANAALQYGQLMKPWAAPGVVEVYVGKPGK